MTAVAQTSRHIHLEPFTVDDAAALYDRATDTGLTHFSREEWLDWAAECERFGPAYSGFMGDELMAAAGIIMRPNNKGDVWAMLSKELCQGYPRVLMRWLKEALPIFKEVVGFTKLRALADDNFGAAGRLLEHLGFTRTRRVVWRQDREKEYRLYIWRAR